MADGGWRMASAAAPMADGGWQMAERGCADGGFR